MKAISRFISFEGLTKWRLLVDVNDMQIFLVRAGVKYEGINTRVRSNNLGLWLEMWGNV